MYQNRHTRRASLSDGRDHGSDIVEREEALDSVGRAQAEPEPRLQAPVVADQEHPRQLEGIEQGQHIASQALVAVVAGGRLGPPEFPQIGADDAVALGEARNDVAPRIPVFRPAMEENERRALLSRPSNVHAQTGGLDDLVIDSRNSRRVIQHDRGELRPAAAALASARLRASPLGRRHDRSGRLRGVCAVSSTPRAWPPWSERVREALGRSHRPP
jgi:hypothetical protein